MITWIHRLQEMPFETLKERVAAQKKEIEIKRRDLETMERILAQRTQVRAWNGQ